MIELLLKSVVAAGDAIMAVYQSDHWEVETKSDDSPITLADKRANALLLPVLEGLNVGPVLSEEGVQPPWEVRKHWQQYWLIDPLDGTKEFIDRNGEFTVNIALIQNGVPVIGVVYAPVSQLCFWGERARGAFCVNITNGSQAAEPIKGAATPKGLDNWCVVGSRSHRGNETAMMNTVLQNPSWLAVGSSLKFCMLANGQAHLYPRVTPTSEWDTAAAQGVLEAAGGVVLEWGSWQPLRYNTKPSLLNPSFLACSEMNGALKLTSQLTV